jgi:hypothetical protein
MDWVEQVCKALAHAHNWHYPDGRRAGVIHGDLHLGNVILHDDDTQSRLVFGPREPGTAQSGILHVALGRRRVMSAHLQRVTIVGTQPRLLDRP